VGRRYGWAGHGWSGRERWPVPPGRGPCRPPAVPGGEGQCAGARQESRQAAIFSLRSDTRSLIGVTSVCPIFFPGKRDLSKIEECFSDIYEKKNVQTIKNCVLTPVLWIRIWIRGPMPLTNGSGFGSGSCDFRH
jgi:hypothetical protein